ncbi:hypothetical protein ACFE04_005126 [Oxalis oulophora]
MRIDCTGNNFNFRRWQFAMPRWQMIASFSVVRLTLKLHLSTENHYFLLPDAGRHGVFEKFKSLTEMSCNIEANTREACLVSNLEIRSRRGAAYNEEARQMKLEEKDDEAASDCADLWWADITDTTIISTRKNRISC